jgi:peptidase E
MEPGNSLFRRKAAPGDIHEQLLSMDLIYVGGGSLLNLLRCGGLTAWTTAWRCCSPATGSRRS